MEPQPASPHSEEIRFVPPELLEQLHDATEHFHDEKQRHEQTMDASEYRHEERVQRSRRRLQRAELELEDITRKIRDALDRPA